MNVTIYGDSILKGVLLEGGRYVVNREWEKRFTESYPIVLNNRSRFGCTIQKAIDTIRKDCRSGCEPGTIALLELGGNDCDYDWAEVSQAPDRDHDCKTPPSRFLSLYREAIGLIRASGRIPVLATLPPIHSERYLRFICRDGLSRKNILYWLGDVDAIYRWQKKYSDMVRLLASEQGVDLVDLRGAFDQDGRSTEELLCVDGIHPSRSGQAVIYQALCAGAVQAS